MLGGLVGTAAIGGMMWFAAAHVPALDAFLSELGAWKVPAYLGLCTLGGVLMVPGSATKLAAGAIFGLTEGMLWGFTGALLGSVAAFGVARAMRHTWLEKRLRAMPRLAHFDESVAEQGGRVVLLVRLSPLLPFNVLNYALGFSRVRFVQYALGSVGMLPSIWLYVYSGDLVRSVGGVDEKPWWEWAILGVGLVATVVATRVLALKAKAALAVESDEDRIPT